LLAPNLESMYGPLGFEQSFQMECIIERNRIYDLNSDVLWNP